MPAEHSASPGLDRTTPEPEKERGEDFLQAFRVALMLAGRREDCYCGGKKGHGGYLVCIEKEADRAC